MTGEASVHRGFRGPRAAMSLTLPGLLACLVAFALLPHDRLLDPLTILLAACTVFASVAWVDLDERLLIDASFVPSVLAMGFLGPAAAFAIVVVGELGSWCVRRYRVVVVPINTFALGVPALIGASALQALGPRGPVFYALLLAIGFGSMVLNDIVLTSLIGVLDDAPIRARLRSHVGLIPAVLINLGLAVATARLFRTEGPLAIAIVLLAIIAFNYMATHVLKAQSRAREIAKLAKSRERLVAQALDAESRERRRLAERLHDETIQDLLAARQDLIEVERGDHESLRRVKLALDGALRALRGAMFDLHPAVLEHAGFSPAFRAVIAEQARVGHFKARADVDPAVGGPHDRLLFAAGRELLRNVAKHAGAQQVDVAVKRQDGEIVLEVADDGRGFDEMRRQTAIASGHVGLAAIEGRLDAIGGSIEIHTWPGQGAHVRVAVPAAVPGEIAATGRQLAR